ncbi:unnamed protein product [Symbiodinium microadriaticum]|nr:unnamed protein product [Symbiodinium microadriaticum]CAE7275289.1 unnamed protein product [Symbiodinium sp. KB8]
MDGDTGLHQLVTQKASGAFMLQIYFNAVSLIFAVFAPAFVSSSSDMLWRAFYGRITMNNFCVFTIIEGFVALLELMRLAASIRVRLNIRRTTNAHKAPLSLSPFFQSLLHILPCAPSLSFADPAAEVRATRVGSSQTNDSEAEVTTKVSTQFNRSQDTQQDKTTNTTIEEKPFIPLRILMMKTFWQELLTRVQRVQSNLQGELGAGLLQKGLITAEGAWTFPQWGVATKSLKATTQTAIPMAEMITLLTEVLDMVQLPDMIHRLTALKPPKTADLSSPTLIVPWKLEVSLRHENHEYGCQHDAAEFYQWQPTSAFESVTTSATIWITGRDTGRYQALLFGDNCAHLCNDGVSARVMEIESSDQNAISGMRDVECTRVATAKDHAYSPIVMPFASTSSDAVLDTREPVQMISKHVNELRQLIRPLQESADTEDVTVDTAVGSSIGDLLVTHFA